MTWTPPPPRAGHPYYMHDAIYAQPGALRLVTRGQGELIAGAAARLKTMDRMLLSGIGTSWHATLVGELLMAHAGRLGHRARLPLVRVQELLARARRADRRDRGEPPREQAVLRRGALPGAGRRRRGGGDHRQGRRGPRLGRLRPARRRPWEVRPATGELHGHARPPRRARGGGR